MEQARIVVVEDHPSLQTVIADYLAEAGHDVIAIADDGDSAVEVIDALAEAEARVDVLLTDKNFPRGGGERVVEAFHEKFAEAVSIGFTTDEGGVRGATENVKKPELKEVLKIIEKLPEPHKQG